MFETLAPPTHMCFASFGFDFTVLLGGGRQRTTLHYQGLPYTFLLDENGRIVQRWTGFAGPH